MPTTPLVQAERPLVLALDLGSSSFRAAVYDRRGREVEGTEGRVPVGWERTDDGGVEADPDRLVEAACRAVDAVLARGIRVEAVGISTFWHSLVGVGPDGRPVTPLYSWADQRSAGAARWLREHLDEDRIRLRTGCVFHPSYPAARLLWVRWTAPAAFDRARWWCGVGEYLIFRLFGDALCSVSAASGTGLLDQHRCRWDPEVTEAVGVAPESLGSLVDLDVPLRGLREPYASRWPSLARIPWVPAAGDGALSNLGTGCVAPSRAALVVGTSAAIRVLHPGPIPPVPRGLWNYRGSRHRILTGGAVSNGGSVYRWIADQVTGADAAGLDRALRSRPADGHGLVVLPFLAGERGPTWPLAARGTVVGLTLSTSVLDLVQAALEAVAHRLGMVWDLLRSVFPGPLEIVASGGALRHLPAWAQILADALGETVILSQEPEGSCRGAALVALEILGAARAEEVPVSLGPRLLPDPERHARYREARARQRLLEAAVAGLTLEEHPPAPAGSPP